MARCRIALANLPFPPDAISAASLAVDAIRDAGAAEADLVCFPEAYLPGYRSPTRQVEPVDASVLEDAWVAVQAAATRAGVGVLLGTERLVNGTRRISTLVVNRDGSVAGFQDKGQLDPSEDAIYAAGDDRRLFQAGDVTFGIAICHEAWRYPETVRWAARRGAQIVFVPHFLEASPASYRPTAFADPANTFHEKALLCRAAENTCYVAGVNYATDGAPTTSAVVRPDGTVLAWQPYGRPGLLIADLDLQDATGLLASRLRTTP